MGWRGDRYPVVRAGDGEAEGSIPIAGQDQVGAADTGAEAQHAKTAAALDAVLPVAPAECERIGAAAAA